MKCPECGKELTENDTLITICDKGKVLGCFHIPTDLWEKVLERFESPEEAITFFLKWGKDVLTRLENET